MFGLVAEREAADLIEQDRKHRWVGDVVGAERGVRHAHLAVGLVAPMHARREIECEGALGGPPLRLIALRRGDRFNVGLTE